MSTNKPFTILAIFAANVMSYQIVKRLALSIFCLLMSSIVYATPIATIIDTDVSSDDGMAILYLLNNKNIDVKAIIADRDGAASPQTAAGHVGYLLQLANRTDIPVYIGLDKNYKNTNTYPAWFYAFCDHAYDDKNITPKNLITQQQLIKLMQNAKQPIAVLSLGSLTNIADTLQKAPQLKSHISHITIMGGAVDVPGNVQVLLPHSPYQYAELNIFVAPAAFKQVLASQIPITLVSLDATNKVPVTMTFLQELAQQQHTPAQQFVYRTLKANTTYIKANEYDFWDPLAAYVFAYPDQIQTAAKTITVILAPGPHFAQTPEDKQGYPVQMVTGLNQDNFHKQFVADLVIH
jgi:inosine-uridine nucleoside N-ribohydrolase